MSDSPQTEMTLDEWVGKLPECHRARKELAALKAAFARVAERPIDPALVREISMQLRPYEPISAEKVREQLDDIRQGIEIYLKERAASAPVEDRRPEGIAAAIDQLLMGVPAPQADPRTGYTNGTDVWISDAVKVLRALKPGCAPKMNLPVPKGMERIAHDIEAFTCKWRHVKTGNVYELVAFASLEWEPDRLCVVYEGQDDRVWVRPYAEFFDGRFVKVGG